MKNQNQTPNNNEILTEEEKLALREETGELEENIELEPENIDLPIYVPKEEIKKAIHAIFFVSNEPITIGKLLETFEGIPEIDDIISETIAELSEKYTSDMGLELQEIADGYQIRTTSSVAKFISKYLKARPRPLPRAQMETLSIVAYKQPITRPEVELIRGVDSSVSLKNLLEKGLLTILGRKETPGTPLIYGTTDRFLQLFSLKNLSSLPKLKDLSSLSDSIQSDIDTVSKPEEQPDNPSYTERIAALFDAPLQETREESGENEHP